MVQVLFGFLLTVTALFMILLILVQRGRGGGLAGAFGGMGGQSAFGTKAGDLFTRITIGVAAFWILLCIAAIKFIPHAEGPIKPENEKVPAIEAGVDPKPGTTSAPGGTTAPMDK